MKLRKTSRSSLTIHSTSSLPTDTGTNPISPYPATSSTTDIRDFTNARPPNPHHPNTYPPPAPDPPSERGRSIKRASTSRYPPSSFLPLQGWSFGRMKSTKGKEKAVERDVESSEFGTVLGTTTEGNAWSSRFGERTAGEEAFRPEMNAQTHLQPTPLAPALANGAIASPSGPSGSRPGGPVVTYPPRYSSDSPHQHHYSQSVEGIPHQSLSSSTVYSRGHTSNLQPHNPRPLSIVSETSHISGDSAAPLIGLGMSPEPSSSTLSTHRKLVKRRPTSTVYEGIEMSQTAISKPKTHNRSLSDSSRPASSYSGPDFTSTPPQIFTVLVDPPSLASSYTHILPDIAHPISSPQLSSLNRNSSSSTSASTTSPATEESDVLATPHNAFLHGRRDAYHEDVWTGLSLREALGMGDEPNLNAKVYIEAHDDYELTLPTIIDDTVYTSSSSNSTIEQIDRASSPTISHAHSSLTNTPTVSSGSTARARHVLRLATSASDLQGNSDDTEMMMSPESISSGTITHDRRRSVTFDSIETDSEVGTVITRRRAGSRSRINRPPLVRIRTSSLSTRHARMRSNSTGGISTNTNSVYSIGEVVLAEGAVLTPARMIRFGDLATAGTSHTAAYSVDKEVGGKEQGDVFHVKGGEVKMEVDTPKAEETVAAFIGSSEAVRRAFQLDEPGAQRGRSIDGSPSRPIPRARKTSHTPRPAPIAPHLIRSPTAPLFGIPIPKSLPPSPKPVRPGLQPRQSSISRLWRRMSSTGGKKRDHGYGSSSGDHGYSTPSTEGSGSGSEIPLLSSTRQLAGKNVLDPAIPVVDSPRPLLASEDTQRSSVKTGKKLSKGKQPIRSITSTEGIKRRIKAYEASSYTDGEVMSPESSWEQINIPTRDSSLQLGIPSRTSSLIRLPVAASKAWISETPPPLPILDDAEGYLYAISGTASRRRRITISTELDSSLASDTTRIMPSVTDDSPGTPTVEQRRKYRQTLVEIKDDRVFQQVLEDLARLETARLAGVAGSDSTPLMPMMLRTPSGDLLEKKARQESIKAWFVTRELVQGERRYGRLLARGVSTVQAAVESRKGEIPPVPVSPLVTTTPSFARNDRITTRARRFKNASASPQITLKQEMTDSALLPSEPPTPLTPSIAPPAPPQTPTSPLDLLLDRLPRLLALSLTLSSNFEHDPSPQGCAQAFWAMEGELTSEIGQWAGEVGNLVAMGMGGILDLRSREASGSTSVGSTPGHSRRGSREASGTSLSAIGGAGEDEVDDRLGFADIIIGPIQRASRYKLLFKELINKLPPDSATRDDVEQALASAERLAAECDSRQVLDMKAFRRSSAANEGGTIAQKEGRRSRRRPQSTGPPVGGWNWFGE